MLSNDMRRGQLGTLKDGVRFRIEDNKRGNIRLATVYASAVGLFDEMGSIYTSEIATVDGPNGPERLEMTPTQKQRSNKTEALMKSIFG